MESPVAIITGAGRGIGRATAIELARAGYRLALIARSEAELAETARLAARSSGETDASRHPASRRSEDSRSALILPTDVRQADQVASALARVAKHYGRIDVLVNCAGYAPVLSLDQLTAAQWQAIVETNLSSVVYTTLAAWPTFKRQGSGVVVNISSFSARDPFPGLGPYGAAKAGVNLLGMAWAKEAKEAGVRIHTIAPAAVETAMFRQIMSEEQFPTGQTLAPQDVARVILQCIAGDLKHTSGEVIWLQKTA